MVVVVVLDALVPERREGHGGGVQPRHVGQQPVGGVAPGVAELHHRGEGLLADVGSGVADEVEEQVLLVLLGGEGRGDVRRRRFFSSTALRETGSAAYHGGDGVLRPQLGFGVHVQQQRGDGGVEDEVVHRGLHLLRPRRLGHVRERHAADEDLCHRQRTSRQAVQRRFAASCEPGRGTRLFTCRRASGGGGGSMSSSAAGASSATSPSFFFTQPFIHIIHRSSMKNFSITFFFFFLQPQ